MTRKDVHILSADKGRKCHLRRLRNKRPGCDVSGRDGRGPARPRALHESGRGAAEDRRHAGRDGHADGHRAHRVHRAVRVVARRQLGASLLLRVLARLVGLRRGAERRGRSEGAGGGVAGAGLPATRPAVGARPASGRRLRHRLDVDAFHLLSPRMSH